MKYTIMHVNDRAKKNIDHNKNILKNFEYVDDIEYFDGNTGNGRDVLNHNRIPLDVWSPYDGRSSPPLPGEYGVWVSTMNLFKYIVNNNIDKILVLEDDIYLKNDFVENLDLCLNELPKNFGFLSLYYFSEQNDVTEESEIGAKYIHKSINQFSAAQAMVYSNKGARDLLSLFRRKGMEYTNDCFIYKQSQVGAVDGYSIKKDTLSFLVHDYKNVKSLIDPDNFRQTDDL